MVERGRQVVKNKRKERKRRKKRSHRHQWIRNEDGWMEEAEQEEREDKGDTQIDLLKTNHTVRNGNYRVRLSLLINTSPLFNLQPKLDVEKKKKETSCIK